MSLETGFAGKLKRQFEIEQERDVATIFLVNTDVCIKVIHKGCWYYLCCMPLLDTSLHFCISIFQLFSFGFLLRVSVSFNSTSSIYDK